MSVEDEKVEDEIHRVLIETLLDYDGWFKNKSKTKLAKTIANKLSDENKKVAVQKYCQKIIDDAIAKKIISIAKVHSYKFVYELNDYNH